MNEQYERIKKVLGTVKEDIPLARFTTFKIGGPADLYYEARTIDDLVFAVGTARSEQVPYFILGGGSNILIGDIGFRGLVIKNLLQKITMRGLVGKRMHGSSQGNVYVEAESGVMMNQFVRFTIEEGLQGLEMHLGLPGSVGGAVYMNSKWMHPEGHVGDAVYQANILRPDGSLETVSKSFFQFSYGMSSIQQTKDIVLSVIFTLAVQDKQHIWKTANQSITYRRTSQPQGVFSPGCTFKNISKALALSVPTPEFTTSAGYLIDHAGLKGKRFGDIEVSTQHANFLINHGKGTASDVVQLIDVIKAKVQELYGIVLQEEIVRVGEF